MSKYHYTVGFSSLFKHIHALSCSTSFKNSDFGYGHSRVLTPKDQYSSSSSLKGIHAP